MITDQYLSSPQILCVCQFLNQTPPRCVNAATSYCRKGQLKGTGFKICCLTLSTVLTTPSDLGSYFFLQVNSPAKGACMSPQNANIWKADERCFSHSYPHAVHLYLRYVNTIFIWSYGKKALGKFHYSINLSFSLDKTTQKDITTQTDGCHLSAWAQSIVCHLQQRYPIAQEPQMTPCHVRYLSSEHCSWGHSQAEGSEAETSLLFCKALHQVPPLIKLQLNFKLKPPDVPKCPSPKKSWLQADCFLMRRLFHVSRKFTRPLSSEYCGWQVIPTLSSYWQNG